MAVSLPGGRMAGSIKGLRAQLASFARLLLPSALLTLQQAPTTPKMPNGCCGSSGGNNYTVCCYSSPRCCKTPMCCSPMQCCSPCCMPMQSCCMSMPCCYTIRSNNNSSCCGGCCGSN
nr:keratin-associated protein 5-1-like [Taeniopygia guttata]